MTPDLIARLREPVDDGTPLTVCHLLDEAADALETLMEHAEAIAKAAVEAVIPLEAMILSGSYQAMCPEMQDGVQNGVAAVRKSLAAFRAAFPGEG